MARRPGSAKGPRLAAPKWRVGDRFELRHDYQTDGLSLLAGATGRITSLCRSLALVVFDSHPTRAPVQVSLPAIARPVVPVKANPAKRRSNSARTAAPRRVKVARLELEAAVELYHKFREAPPRRVRLERFKLPQVCVVIGEMDFVGYTTTHARKRARYRHDFRPTARPLLCASSDGRQLLIFGGNYDFTRDGIVDRA